MSQKPQQQVVRVGGLERTLEGFNLELAEKTSVLLTRYHEEFVESRLAALETPWYRKAWAWLRERIGR
jgi:hypothetical protein